MGARLESPRVPPAGSAVGGCLTTFPYDLRSVWGQGGIPPRGLGVGQWSADLLSASGAERLFTVHVRASCPRGERDTSRTVEGDRTSHSYFVTF